MTEKEFKDSLFKTMPASIHAEIKADASNVNIKAEGRGVELLALTLAIVQSVYKKQPLSAQKFGEFITEYLVNECKDDTDNTMSLFRKMFKDIGDK